MTKKIIQLTDARTNKLIFVSVDHIQLIYPMDDNITTEVCLIREKVWVKETPVQIQAKIQ